MAKGCLDPFAWGLLKRRNRFVAELNGQDWQFVESLPSQHLIACFGVLALARQHAECALGREKSEKEAAHAGQPRPFSMAKRAEPVLEFRRSLCA